MVGTAAGCWVVRSLHAHHKAKSHRTWNVECSKCGRKEVKTERQLDKLVYAHSSGENRRVTGCGECYETRKVVAAGDRFGLWEVVGVAGQSTGRQVRYTVRCRCGAVRVVAGGSLRMAGRRGGSGGCRSCRQPKRKKT